MANTFLPRDAAAVAVALAVQDSYLSALINRSYENDLLGGGGQGRTVNIRIPGTLIARERDIEDITSSIVLDNLTETSVPLTLGTHVYSAVPLSEGDMTLNLTDFSAQVLRPQIAAVVDRVENMVATLITGAPITSGITYDATNPVKAFTQIRKVLRDRGVPQTGLNVVVGTDVYADLLNADLITFTDRSGSTEALREGNIGRIRGFDIVESNRIDAGEIIAFHRDAYTLAVRAPVVPSGASFGAAQSSGGYSLRYLRDYDIMHTVDRSLVSTFAGVAALPLKQVKRTYTGTGSPKVEVVDVAQGAVVHIKKS